MAALGLATASDAASSTIFRLIDVRRALPWALADAFRWSAGTGEPCSIASSTSSACMRRRYDSTQRGVGS
ncbi:MULTISPECIES: hypothetical protein [Paraburkholderia]|uniref:hypothetical protein n=1 Tax=Paraburkholderia TaxID=1822464 RepID=UPI0038BD385D